MNAISLSADARRYVWPVAGFLVLILANLLITPEFFHLEIKDGRLYGSLVDVLNRAVPVALVAIGMTLVIATGGVDLSVGAVMAIAGAVSANLIVAGVDNIVLIVGGGLLAGLLAGLVNGTLVGFMGIQPIVATLILMVAGRGIAQLINAGQIVTFHHETFGYLGSGHFLGLPFPIIVVALVFCLVQLIMRRTALGLFVEAVGCNPRASHYVGINQKFIKLLVYSISGLCAALAGMISTADISGSDANNVGLWLELDAILAVVIGGATLAGGRFSVFLSIVGALIIQALTITIVMSGVPPRFNLLIKAVTIVTILLLQSPEFHRQLARLYRGLRSQ